MGRVKTVQVSTGTSAGTVTGIDGTATAKSADYTVLDTDRIRTILMTTGASTRTVTLPTAADNANRILSVKKIDSGVGTVIIDGEGAETIEGAANYTISARYDEITIQCDGATWHILERSSIEGTATAKVADYTVLDGDRILTVLMTTGASNRTVILPTAADNTNRTISIKKVDSGSGAVIIDGEGAETIDGDIQHYLAKQYHSMTIQCDGTTWHVLSYDFTNFVESAQTTMQAAAATGVYKQIDAITIPPGVWNISVDAYLDTAGMTSPNNLLLALSTTTASAAGTTLLKTLVYGFFDTTAGIGRANLSTFRLNLTTGTTYFVNGRVSYGGTATQGWQSRVFMQRV